LKIEAALFAGPGIARRQIRLPCLPLRPARTLQESVGLDVVTDGEIGRLNFQDSFGLAVTGYDAAPDTLHVHRSASRVALRRWDIPDLAAVGAPVSHRRPVVRRLELANNVALAEDGVCDIELVSVYNK
jgi:5-methyltetrahydropteroyltriglutamate--homocysteine methyltransferase